MPWCPRCDETFPQGPACPRCSARLVARDHDTFEDALHNVPGLRSIKVPRRHMKAFERMSGPRANGSRALALALVMLVFASGFLLGRVGSFGAGGGPTVSALPPSKPLAIDEAANVPAIKGSVSYLIDSRESLATIASHDLYSGAVAVRARFSPPVDLDPYAATRVVSFERSIAVVVTAGRRGYIAMAPHNQPAQAWVPGTSAAWASERELLIRHTDGTVGRWTLGADGTKAGTIGDVDELIPTTAGPVVRRGSVLETINEPKRRLVLPPKAKVLAVSPDMTRALLDGDPPALWDGRRKVEMRSGSGEALGAAFDHSSERVAISLRTDDGARLAVMDVKGNVSLKPLSGRACTGAPSWDAAALWIYLSGTDGVLHAVEASGGRVESVRTQAAGCGVAWVNTRS